MSKLRFLLLLSLPCIAMVHTGCASWQQNKWLGAHRTELQRLASSNLSGEQKIDGLVNSYIRLMNEGLRFVDPVKGAKYIKKYHDQNQGAIEKILNDANRWQSNLDTAEKLVLAARMAKKPYYSEIVDLAPAFKRKYEQYAFIVNMTSKVTGGLGKLIGKILF